MSKILDIAKSIVFVPNRSTKYRFDCNHSMADGHYCQICHKQGRLLGVSLIIVELPSSNTLYFFRFSI